MIFKKKLKYQSHRSRCRVSAIGAIIYSVMISVVFASVACADESAVASASKLGITQVLQQVIDTYPSLEKAAISVQQAKVKVDQVRGQLDWRLQAAAGVSRDPGLFLGTTDNIKTSASFSRRLENGDSVSLTGSLVKSDSEMSFAPNLPNPSYNTQIRLNYRKPLLQGKGSPGLTGDINNAEVGIEIAQASRKSAYENVLRQVIELFYSINTTVRQVENIHQSLQRTKRLKKFIESRLNLGIAEDKDMLQILAQIDGQNAQLQVLDTAMRQQFINLNRLLTKHWDSPLNLELKHASADDKGYQENLDLVKTRSPSLAIVDYQLKVVENNINKIRDAAKDAADLVFFAGGQSLSGDATTGSVSENNGIGGVSIEYRIDQGNKSKAALLADAQFQQDMTLLEKKQILQNIEYDVAELVSGIQSVKAAEAAYQKSVNSELKKLEDAEKRYRRGRIDIDRVIGFENQLSASELSLEIQRIEIERRRELLSVLNGEIWNRLTLPSVDATVQTPNAAAGSTN